MIHQSVNRRVTWVTFLSAIFVISNKNSQLIIVNYNFDFAFVIVNHIVFLKQGGGRGDVVWGGGGLSDCLHGLSTDSQEKMSI